MKINPVSKSRIATWILIPIIILLIVFELGLRIAGLPFTAVWLPTEMRIAIFEKQLGWDYIPNSSSVQKFGTDQRNIKLSFNDISARVENKNKKFDKNRPTILLVGCSVTMGHGVPYNETFGSRLESNPKFPYQVINLGVQGYGTDQALLKLRRYINQFNVKSVIYVYIPQHLYRNNNYDRRVLFPKAKFIGTKPIFELNNEKELVLSRKPIKFENYSYSRLYALMMVVTGNTRRELGPLTKALILEMNSLTESVGAHFTAIDWKYDKRTSILASLNIDLIDLAHDAPAEFPDWNIPGDYHPDGRANKYLAETIFKHFKKLNLIL